MVVGDLIGLQVTGWGWSLGRGGVLLDVLLYSHK